MEYLISDLRNYIQNHSQPKNIPNHRKMPKTKATYETKKRDLDQLIAIVRSKVRAVLTTLKATQAICQKSNAKLVNMKKKVSHTIVKIDKTWKKREYDLLNPTKPKILPKKFYVPLKENSITPDFVIENIEKYTEKTKRSA